MKLGSKLRNKRYILLDCDGVVWKGNYAIKDAQKVLEKLEQAGIKLGFVTNNSSLSREGFIKKFKKLGFNPDEYIVVNSAYGASVYLKERNYSRIFIIGESGLREELEFQGIYVAEKYEPELEGVCIGWDRQLTWQKLADAMRVIINDKGFFLGTNPDNSYPMEEFLVPGAGAGIAALANACSKEPDVIIGKPNRFLLDLTLKEMFCTKIDEAVYIGDRLSTDIAAGINTGMDTILVHSGISDDHLINTINPSRQIDSIADIFTVIDERI
ncbi:MAG: HAD-IIA family hydrolase [Candidatus Hodarchaeales archaeon]